VARTRRRATAEVSARVLALALDQGKLRRLRVAHRADLDTYQQLVTLTAVTLAASGQEMVITGTTGNADHMTVREYAEATGRSSRSVRRDCADGTLSAVKRGRDWSIPRAELVREVAR
jgi:hypothetical protein